MDSTPYLNQQPGDTPLPATDITASLDSGNPSGVPEAHRHPSCRGDVRTRQGHEWVDVTTGQIFAGKTVVVFALPGALTPTCSSSHMPRDHQLVRPFRAQGVDGVVCISVNDAFLMNAWQKVQTADHLTFLPDGNGDFTARKGMPVDKDGLGFGKRSWRYSMLVREGAVRTIFIEPDRPGDPFEVADADTMLRYLAPTPPSRWT